MYACPTPLRRIAHRATWVRHRRQDSGGAAPRRFASGFGLLLDVNTGSLRQAIVPSHLFGRVISIAGVLARSGIPLGALAGARLIEATDVRTVYVGMGLVTAAIAVAFSFSPVREGDRYLAEAKAATEAAAEDGAPVAPAPA